MKKNCQRNCRAKSILRLDPVITLCIIAAGIVSLLLYTPRPGSTSSVALESKSAIALPNVPHPEIHQATGERPLGHLVFESEFFDFGKVNEGDVVRHVFKFRNAGAAPVRVAKTETSCGCTTASNALKEYAPGESGELDVTVDTVDKKGVVVKTVKLMLEGDQNEVVELSLAMTLLPPAHPKKEKLPNLNTDVRCKSCHLESGKGQSGIFLYHRVCVQCHGKKGAGGTARALNDAAWQQGVRDDYIRKRITDGWPERSMPSFVKGVTPALDEDQVESLLQYIRKMANDRE